MSKLNQEELLEDLEFVLATWKRHYPHKLPPMRILQIFENFKQIKKMIQKPGVTEEWIEEKAKTLHRKIFGHALFGKEGCRRLDIYEDFIRSLVEEIK